MEATKAPAAGGGDGRLLSSSSRALSESMSGLFKCGTSTHVRKVLIFRQPEQNTRGEHLKF
jgi:hypothetical protein